MLTARGFWFFVVVVLTLLIAVAYGARQIATGRLTTGQIASFFAAAFLMYGPVKKLSRVNANLQQAMAACERIFDMLDTHTEVHESPLAPPLAPFRRLIEITEVGFGYDEQRMPGLYHSLNPRSCLGQQCFSVHDGAELLWPVVAGDPSCQR